MENKIWNVNSHARMVNYKRVGTKNQKGNNSLKAQEKAYRKDRKRYGWITIASITDIGSGASINQRKGIKEVLRLVRNKKIDGVYVTDPDRLYRPVDLRDLAEIYDAFVENGVKLVTPARVYDLSRDDDLFSFESEGVLERYYHRRLLQNMKKGKVSIAKKEAK